jgi:hypothetical protein
MTRTLHEQAMTRTLSTLDCTYANTLEPHDKTRKTDILETSETNSWFP